nr:hypothetical protein [Streptococcus canis]
MTAIYLHPREISLLVSKEGQNARILLVSHGHIEKLNQRDEILVIPSFFSVTHDNHICTFSWGDSHHRFSYRARLAAEADKNSLDITSIFVVHSRVIHNPHSIKKFTYKERQKLPYAGFSVFHDEILLLTYRGNILIIIQNTTPFLTLIPIVLEHKENRDYRNTTKSLPENYVNLSMVSKVQAKFPLCLL